MDIQSALDYAQNPIRLQRAKSLGLLNAEADSIFDRFTNLASRIIQAPVALVSIIDKDCQLFKGAVGLPEPYASIRKTPLSHSFCKHVTVDQEALIIEDARNHKVLKDNLAIPDLNVIAYLGIPLVSSDGLGLGSFCVFDNKPRRWTSDEVVIMSDLAENVMTEIELRAQVQARKEAEAALQTHLENLEATIAHHTNELNTAYVQLQEIDKLKSKLINTISHELRTPVTNFGLYLHLLKNGQPSKRDNYIHVLDQQWRLLTQLVDDVVQFSQISLSANESENSILDLNWLVKQVMNASSIQSLKREGVLLEKIIHPYPLLLKGNAALLERLIKSLLENALAFTFQGQVEISTFRTPTQKQVGFQVIDTGIGLREEDIPHLFDRFYRGHAAQESDVPGIGLGLTVAQRIAETHGGTIIASAKDDSGANFLVTLPAAV